MIIKLKSAEIEAPDVIPVDELQAQGEWLYNLFTEVAIEYRTPKAIWDYTFNQLFLDSQLTEQHKYCICMAFTALITSLELSESFTKMIAVTIPNQITQLAKEALPSLYYLEGLATDTELVNEETTPSESFLVY
jgi:hypothetical protein